MIRLCLDSNLNAQGLPVDSRRLDAYNVLLCPNYGLHRIHLLVSHLTSTDRAAVQRM
jgi:hypothetical protein